MYVCACVYVCVRVCQAEKAERRAAKEAEQLLHSNNNDYGKKRKSPTKEAKKGGGGGGGPPTVVVAATVPPCGPVPETVLEDAAQARIFVPNDWIVHLIAHDDPKMQSGLQALQDRLFPELI